MHNGCCGARVINEGYSGGGDSQPSENDQVATMVFTNDNPAVIGGVVEGER